MKKIPTTAALTMVPMFGPHFPRRNAMMATATVTQVKANPMTISVVVLMDPLKTKACNAAIAVAESVPPIQMGLESQYRMAVMAPGSRPKASFTHSYTPPS